MGWPTKGTGSNYNSHTGFGSFIGAYNKKIIMSLIFCRRCRVCEVAKQKFTPVRKHECVQNWASDQSSKSMESAMILSMACNSVARRQFVMNWIVSDDDNVMCAYSHHVKEDDQNHKASFHLGLSHQNF